MARSVSCPTCSQPVLIAPDQTRITCAHCGAVLRVGARQAKPPAPPAAAGPVCDGCGGPLRTGDTIRPNGTVLCRSCVAREAEVRSGEKSSAGPPPLRLKPTIDSAARETSPPVESAEAVLVETPAEKSDSKAAIKRGVTNLMQQESHLIVAGIVCAAILSASRITLRYMQPPASRVGDATIQPAPAAVPVGETKRDSEGQ